MSACFRSVWRSVRRFFAYLILLLTVTALLPAQAANLAVGWIESQAAADGSIAASAEPASVLQATAEALLVLDWSAAPAIATSAANYLTALQTITTESLARQIVIAVKAGQDIELLANRMIAAQNADGGFGETSGYQSTVLDTASALEALAYVDRLGAPAASRAVQFLLTSQSTDGGYRLEGDESGAVYVTAMVARVLSRYRVEYSVSSAIARAIAFIESKQESSGRWYNNWETAAALLALAPAGADAATLGAASAALEAAQNADGSWDNSVYVTALAVRALQAAEEIPLPPVANVGVISGRVLDAANGLPISAAVLSAVSGVTATAGSDGTFTLAGVSTGAAVISVSAAGYASADVTVNVSAGGTASLGNILLNPLPNTGTLRGVLTRATNGMPVPGALVSAAGTTTASTQSDQAGFFSLVLTPGPVSLSVVAEGFEPVAASGTITEGDSLWFSPVLLAAGTLPSVITVTIQGSVIDGATGEPLPDVAIAVSAESGQWSAVTNDAGNFVVAGVNAGEKTIALTKSGYQAISFSVIAGEGGSIGLGTVRLVPETLPTSSIIAGQVVDADTNAPVPGAEVQIQDIGSRTVSATDGSYSIAAGALTKFSVTVSASGYASATGSVELAQPGVANVDIPLHRMSPADFDVVRIETDAQTYPAFSKVNAVAVLGNSGNSTRTVVLQVNVLNETGESVEQYPAVRIPLGGNTRDAWITVEPGVEFPVPVEWNTDRYPAGLYRLVIDAVDASTGRLLAQRAAVVDVESTRHIGGNATFEPPIAQLAAKHPIRLSSLIANQGNEPIATATVNARVTLEREGYGPRTDLLEFKTVAKADTLTAAQGLAVADDGSLYTTSRTGSKILRILSSGTVETFVENVPLPVDVDVANGKVYALRSNGTVDVVDADGTRVAYATGVAGALSLKAHGDGRILIGSTSGVYERATDGQVRKLSGVGLAAPQGVIEIQNGDLIIADSGQNALVRYSGGRVTPFIEGINQPYSLAAEADGTLYIGAFGSNSLYRVASDGQSSVLADGLGGPYDVQLRPDGAVLVSNYTTSSVVSVAPDGSTHEVVGRTIGMPTAAEYDAMGNLYLANQKFGNIVRMAPDGTVSEVSGTSDVQDVVVAWNGGLDVLRANGQLIHIAADGAVGTIASGLTGAQAATQSGDGGWFVAQSTGRIAKVSAEGVVSGYIERALNSPIAVRALPDGGFYVLSPGGMLTHISADGTVNPIVSGLGACYGLAVDTEGNLFTSEPYQKRIVRVSPAGEIVRMPTSFSPGALAVAADGALLVGQWYGNQVFRMDAAGNSSEFARMDYPVVYDMFEDADGTLWVPHYSARSVTRIARDGTKVVATLPNPPYSVSADGTGGAYVATYGGVAHVDDMGTVTTALTHPDLSYQYQVGALRGPDGTYTTIDALGRISRFDVQRNLIGRYATIAGLTDIARTDAGLLVASGTMVLLYRDPSKLAEIVAMGSYRRLAVEPSGSVLLVTTASVSRLSADFTTIQPLTSGYNNISSVAASSSGSFAVADSGTNKLATHATDGSLIDSFHGLVNPKGVLTTADGDLLVINSYPAGVMKVMGNGRLSVFYSLSGAERMALEPDGSILVSSTSHVIHLDAEGRLLDSHVITSPRGLVRASSGQLYYTSGNSGLFTADGTWAVRQVASGLSKPVDLALDSSGIAYLADSSRGVVNRIHPDGSLGLAATGLSQASAILFDRNDNLYVGYGSGAVATFGSDGVRTELPTSGLGLGPIAGLGLPSSGNLLGLASNKGLLVEMKLAPPDPIQVGEVVYSASVIVPNLGLDGAPVPVDFGAWTPSVAGDYRLEVQVADGLAQGSLINTLHVGPNAEATLTLDRHSVLPGDRNTAGQLTIIGADSTSITQIDPEGAALAAASYAYGRAIAADTRGNIFAADTNRIVKMSPDGQLSDFITGISVGNGMAVDSRDFIYIPSAGKIAKLSPDGTVAAVFTVPGSAYAVAVSHDDKLYATTSRNLLVAINEDGTHEIVASTGLSTPMGLTIDAYGYFYVLNAGNKIVRISPDGTSTVLYYDKADFEYEGVNVVADCSNNLLFAPITLPPFKSFGEEDVIIQLVGDTGEVRQVLYGPSIDKTLTDIDVLFYDRFGQRLLMWGDVHGGKIFSFPVKCGGIDAEAHLVARSDVDLSSADPAPDQAIDRPDGTREYVWMLEQVDNRGRTTALNLLFHDLAESESRPMLQDAFLSYSNSFAPEESVTVPITIPELLAQSRMSVTPALSGFEFGADALVTVSVAVENGGDTAFDGRIAVQIVDAAGAPIAELPTTHVAQLGGGDSGIYSVDWNTGSTFIGSYAMHVRLTNADGLKVADGVVDFEIVAGSGTGASILMASVTPDRAVYPAWTTARLDFSVVNVASNANIEAGTVELAVSDPAGAPLHFRTLPLPSLVAGGRSAMADQVALMDAADGQYKVLLVVRDATGSELTRAVGGFLVERMPAEALTGHVQIGDEVVNAGETTVCTETVVNRGGGSLTGVTVTHRVVDLQAGTVLTEQGSTVDLSGGESNVAVHSVDSTGLAPGGYACLLNAELSGQARRLAQGTFQVMPPPVRLDTAGQLGSRGRLLVLIDAERHGGHTAGDHTHHDDEDGYDDARDRYPQPSNVACHASAVVDLRQAYGQSIGHGDRVEVELLDERGTLLDAEFVHVDDERLPVNRGSGSGGVDLSIESLTDGTIAFTVGGAGAGGSCRTDELTARVSVWHDGSLAAVTDNIETVAAGALVRQLSLLPANNENSEGLLGKEISQDQKQAHIEALLTENGWHYTLVADADAFTREFRSGGYVAYLLLSDAVKLPEQVQQELREAVFRGEGLIVAGAADERNGRLDETLGVRFKGKLADARGILFDQSPFGLDGEVPLTTDGKPVRIEPNGAVAAAYYATVGHGHHEDGGHRHGDERDAAGKHSGRNDDHHESGQASGPDAAVVYHSYGAGRSAYAGFDLLAEATADSSTAFDELIDAMLGHIQPHSIPTVTAAVIPLQFTLVNQGMAVPVRLVLSLPAGATVVDPAGGTAASGSVAWAVPLAEQATVQFVPWLRLPAVPGGITFDAVLQADGGGGFVDYTTMSVPVLVKGASLEAARAAVEALGHDRHYRKAAQQLAKADDYLAAGRPDKAHRELLDAADALARIGGEEADAIRRLVGAAIRDVGMSLTTADHHTKD